MGPADLLTQYSLGVLYSLGLWFRSYKKKKLGGCLFFRAAPVAQAKGPIEAVAASLRQSHNNSGSELSL